MQKHGGVLLRREMTEKRFKHLRWREKRPPMLPFESYVLLQKVAHAPEGKAAPPETADIMASGSAATEAVSGPASHPL